MTKNILQNLQYFIFCVIFCWIVKPSATPSATTTTDQKESVSEESPEATSLHKPNDSDDFSHLASAAPELNTNENL